MHVQFYLTTAFEIVHFAPIVRALRALNVDAELVSPKQPRPEYKSFYDGKYAENVLTYLNLPFTDEADVTAEVAVTTQGAVLDGYRGKKVRLMYGVGVVPAVKPIMEMSSGFHNYLVHGPLTERIQFRYHGWPSSDLPREKVKSIGYPYFDQWFAGTTLIERPQMRHRQTILYMPTWAERSSIDAFADAIFALADRFEDGFNILVKPHHCTARQEPQRMAKLESGPVHILGFASSPEYTFSLADVVIADISSGAFTEAILARKPVVGLGTRWDIRNLLLPNLCRTSLCTDPARLSQAVDAAQLIGDIPSVRKQLFDSSEGRDAERAARAIVEAADG